MVFLLWIWLVVYSLENPVQAQLYTRRLNNLVIACPGSDAARSPGIHILKSGM